MASGLQLKVKGGEGWIRNFHLGAWKVRNDDNNGWLPMNPYNSKVRNPEFDESNPESDTNILWLKIGGPDVDN